MREMSNLDKALETLKETKKGTQWGDQKHKEAIEYLESLKPTIPIFVARWFEDSIKNQMSIYTIVDYYASDNIIMLPSGGSSFFSDEDAAQQARPQCRRL